MEGSLGPRPYAGNPCLQDGEGPDEVVVRRSRVRQDWRVAKWLGDAKGQITCSVDTMLQLLKELDNRMCSYEEGVAWLVLDCPMHCSVALNETRPRVRLAYAPPSFTGASQPVDVAFARRAKSTLRCHFANIVADSVEADSSANFDLSSVAWRHMCSSSVGAATEDLKEERCHHMEQLAIVETKYTIGDVSRSLRRRGAPERSPALLDSVIDGADEPDFAEESCDEASDLADKVWVGSDEDDRSAGFRALTQLQCLMAIVRIRCRGPYIVHAHSGNFTSVKCFLDGLPAVRFPTVLWICPMVRILTIDGVFQACVCWICALLPVFLVTMFNNALHLWRHQAWAQARASWRQLVTAIEHYRGRAFSTADLYTGRR